MPLVIQNRPGSWRVLVLLAIQVIEGTADISIDKAVNDPLIAFNYALFGVLLVC